MSFVFPSVQGESVPRERSGHVSVFWNGFVIVWGGYRDYAHDQIVDQNIVVERYHDSSELWLYSVESSTWKCMITRGDIPPRLSGSCAACADNAMYLFAGHSDQGPLSTVYMLNLKTLEWTNLSDWLNDTAHGSPSPRDKFCCWQHNELIIFFGGYGTPPSRCDQLKCYGEFVYNAVDLFGDNRGWNNNIYILDTLQVQWINVKIEGEGPTPRAAHAGAKLGSKAYLYGGRFMSERMNDLYWLDLNTWKWSGSLVTTGCVPAGSSWHSLTPVSKKHLLLYGGYNNNSQPLGDVCLLDTDLLMWSNITPANIMPSLWHTACSTSNEGEVVIFGGCSSFLHEDIEDRHLNRIMIFRFTALSLQSLCVDAVVKHYTQLSGRFKNIPNSLRRSLIAPSRLLASGLN